MEPATNEYAVRMIGVLGGLSWESIAEYYRVLIEVTAEPRGRLPSAHVPLRSVDFADIEARQGAGDWMHIASQTLLGLIASPVPVAVRVTHRRSNHFRVGS